MRRRVRTLTTARAHVGTRPTVSFPQRSVTKNEIGITGTCVTLSTIEMLTTILKTGDKNETTSSKSDAMKGTTSIMAIFRISLTGIPRRRTQWRGQSFLPPLEEGALAPELQDTGNREVRWVHQPSRVAQGVSARHRSYRWGLICDSKLLVCLSSSAKTWPLGLPMRSVHSWSHLC
jgi:hypothetical protein